ncbi:DUF2017 domain-containing protein [Corynebacterium heidelbergense]|uniref:DUF2017 domain-containing protein n=1 Tax=Corynebacterium heidelbergense TaxID=2055947 RepID=A0A364VAH2_9CORY|nr:DUF2017 domain-containing protein [Corynebacterium heidelbergense]RAV33673.1 DUF2017 domain-containing protein [Corynebacterium heidelbergense]WCZ36132.1 hypothetical protein CHEID_02855 [Corynebacterium heidelbergense]
MEPWVKKGSLLRGARFITRLEPMEREMLGDSAASVSEKLMERARTAPKDELAEMTGMPSGHAHAPDDPGLRRVLPSFFREGGETVEGEASLTRQLNETDIIKAKLVNLRFISDALGPDGSVNVSLTPEETHPWLGAITDIRNYHSAQLEQFAAELGEDSQQVQAGRNYLDWLGFHLDSLLQAVMGELDVPGDGDASRGGSQGRGE